MSELKGCFVSTGSVGCWAVLTHVIGFRLSYVVSSSESSLFLCPPLGDNCTQCTTGGRYVIGVSLSCLLSGERIQSILA